MRALLPVALASTASAAPPPIVAFMPVGSRWLVYDQNPEVVMPSDLVDAGFAHLYIDALRGRARIFTELESHLNSTLGYAAAVTNPASSTAPVSVNVTALGFDADEDGGKAFFNAFNNPGPQTNLVLLPGQSGWVFRNDDAARKYQQIFSAVCDVETNDTVSVSTVAYTNFSSFALPLKPLPYITRVDPGPDHEARVYKGLVGTSEVATSPLMFSVDDSVANGTILSVAYPTYNSSTRQYNAIPSIFDGITTNDNPLANPAAVGSDMVGSLVYTPGWGFMDPWGCCDGGGEGSIVNQANWGVVYHIKGAVTNAGGDAASLVITLRNTGCLAPIAWSPGPDQPWQSTIMWSPGNETLLAVIPLPPSSASGDGDGSSGAGFGGSAAAGGGGLTTFHVRWVLGGPSCGGEFTYFTVRRD